jgi:hypothetical protein
MPPLPRELRKALETTVVSARVAAEDAARAALSTLAVDRDKAFEGMTGDQRTLRRALRAKERQLGSYDVLISEIAYQHWHRMLFARFLAENSLLIHPDAGIGVSLEEVADLAREEGEPDPWILAARYAAQMLPAIFREHDPTLEIAFAPEGRKRLEGLLASLPTSVFTSDDALGWVYQFWQSEKKKQVNRTGNRIGAAELPAVTQLFTEDYMVRFLLENSLGGWWAARHPDSPLIAGFTYLRCSDEGTPVGGMFDTWPERVAEVTVMDPCCGSGHFLTVAFEMLAAMRAEEEGLSAREAGDAVIAENLFGLELDPRCTQIAAFALALLAWRSGGHRDLPAPNIACSGIGVAGQLEEWKKLAEGEEAFENALTALHQQFRNAPELGSLIDPRRATEEGHLFSVDYDRVAPLLEQLLTREEDPEVQVAGWAAAGIARAASLLARTYTLVATNVPYLTNFRQSSTLRRHCESGYAAGKADLAAALLLRAIGMAREGGTISVVSPANWLSLAAYKSMREEFLRGLDFRVVARLGGGAFETISGEVVKPTLIVISRMKPSEFSEFAYADATTIAGPSEKSAWLASTALHRTRQSSQLQNAAARITGAAASSGVRLDTAATCIQGLATSDDPQFTRNFWELDSVGPEWERLRGSVKQTTEFGGCERLLLWEEGVGRYFRHAMALKEVGRLGGWKSGTEARGRRGVIVSQVGMLSASLYLGEFYSHDASVIIPKNADDLSAIWCFCQADQYQEEVRKLDQKLYVTNATLVQVPFDLDHWTKVAEERYPDGLPEPYSNDATQWLFKGDPTDATEPLHVAVTRLLGYRWPDQEPDSLDELVDADGAVPIPALAGERSAAERLRVLLERAWADAWSTAKLDALLAQAGVAGKDLDTWLRDSFFSSHAKLFHNRPFIWHIWDGRKDGFGVLVNYHRLDRQLLDRITHTLLGSWIEAQRDQVRRELPGAEARLGAAQELQRRLEQISHGEPPYDIYVRWKSRAEQPIGWDPDLNDGVRLNVRPFVEADVLRGKFTINWNKDRGKDPDGSERLNDLHLPRAEKEMARGVGQRP